MHASSMLYSEFRSQMVLQSSQILLFLLKNKMGFFFRIFVQCHISFFVCVFSVVSFGRMCVLYFAALI